MAAWDTDPDPPSKGVSFLEPRFPGSSDTYERRRLRIPSAALRYGPPARPVCRGSTTAFGETKIRPTR